MCLLLLLVADHHQVSVLLVCRWMHWVTDDWDSLQPGDYVERKMGDSNGSSSSSPNELPAVTSVTQ